MSDHISRYSHVGQKLHAARRWTGLAWLAESTPLIPAGLPVTLHSTGDFSGRNADSALTAAGQKVFTNETDGTTMSAAAGGAAAGAVESKWFVMSVAALGELMKISTRPLG